MNDTDDDKMHHIANISETTALPEANLARSSTPNEVALSPASLSETSESSSSDGESPKCPQGLCQWCAQIDFLPVAENEDPDDESAKARAGLSVKRKRKWELPLKDPDTCSLCAFFRSAILKTNGHIPELSEYVLEEESDGWFLSSNELGFLHFLLDMHKKIPKENATHLRFLGRKVQPICVDYPSIKAWLHSCDIDHDQCSKAHANIAAIPGLRFIDCATEHIIPASEACGLGYVTLSYVWGASSQVSGSPTAAGPASVLPAYLPRVIQDAMTVTIMLGYRYLWVDRYCIPQNDQSAKHIQIQNMGNIYACSTLTIIAAAGEDAEHGLPGVGSRPRIPHLSVDLGNYSVVEFRVPHYEIESSTWSTRGWTYQEAVLARRRLVFTDTRVYFQCQQGFCAEDLASHHIIRYDWWAAFPSVDGRRSCSAVWDRILEFSKRRLTYDRDALEAISGILAKYREDGGLEGGDGILCGLPIPSHEASSTDSDGVVRCRECRARRSEGFGGTECLVRSLSWEDYWDYATDVPSETPRRTMFPSWTWAGWKSTSQLVLRVRPLLEGHQPWQHCTVDIHAVYEEGGLILNWRDCAKQILELSWQGIEPSFLDIEAPCFDIGLIW